MDLYQEVRPCPNCRTRLTLCGRQEAGSDRVVRQEVTCPVCRTGVAFAVRGMLDPGSAILICYERPLQSHQTR